MIRLILVCCLFVAISACGASSPQYERPAYAPPASQSPMSDSNDQVLVTSTESDDSSFFARKSARKSAEPTKDASLGGSGAAEPQTSMDQKLVKNAWLTIRLRDEKNFPEAVQKCERIARSLEGYVASTSRSSISFKVPTGRLDEALAAVSELGKVTHRDVTTVDVTANYVDLEIRIENLKKLRVRLQELVVQGQNVEEILHVEKELARVTSQLEALEGQMRVLGNQTSYATLTVTFNERVRPGPIGWVFYGLYHGVKWLFVWD